MIRAIRVLGLFAATLILSALSVPRTAVADDTALWAALRDGRAIAVMRHALAPGTGDPANFALNDCGTQRNLDDRGRAQARAIGQQFAANGIPAAEVLTSQWCRCRDTARLLGLGEPSDRPELNSFFRNMAQRDAQTRELKAWLQANPAQGARILVTHQVNVSALTGRFTRSGEIIVTEVTADGAVNVLGSLRPG